MAKQTILDDFDFNEQDFFPEEGDSEVVGKFYSSMEAEVAAARLRAEGIPCFLANTNASSILTSTMVMMRLHVRPEDMDRAKALLLSELPQGDEHSEMGSIWKSMGILLGVLGILGLAVFVFRSILSI
jgi:hypothetical protein